MSHGLREAERQQALLAAILRRSDAAVLQPWLRDTASRGEQGLAAYRRNVASHAERALALAYPTVAELVSESSFAGLARAYLHAAPPLRGDLGWLGEHLPTFIQASEMLADEPYLADVARLDWAVHRATTAADVGAVGDGPLQLERLGDTDPGQLRLLFAPGAAVRVSRHPIVAIWAAHHAPPQAADRFAPVRAAFAEGRGETAWVWRAGWRPRVQAVSPAEAAFNAALLVGQCLGPALASMSVHADFAFDAWLVKALQAGWLAAVQVVSNNEEISS